jgi:chromosome segregation ATPase
MNTKRFIMLAVGCAMLVLPACVAAQDQDQNQSQGSVADAARKAQAERKNAPKSKLTIDNDNLGTLTGQVNVVGEEPPAADDQSKKSAADDKAAKAPAKDEGYWRDKFAGAYKKLADDQHELDILQREFNLKQEQFYTDPMASLKQEYSRQDLNDQKAKIDDKKATVDQDKVNISSLEDELRQAGGDAGWATPPSQPASGQSAESQPAAASAPAAPQP